MATVTEENYLKAMFALADADGRVNVSDLSRTLGVSTPSASNMARRLAEAGQVEYRRYKPLRLTPAGRRAAALVVRKHRLTEMFLVERMGFGWEEVHAIAEQIEHVNSAAFFQRMDELMGHPTVDPHGSPIPDAAGNLRPAPADRQRLSQVAVGQTVTVAGLAHNSNDFLHFLNDRGLSLGTKLTVDRREAFDESLTVSYDGHPGVSFSKMVCDRLLVE